MLTVDQALQHIQAASLSLSPKPIELAKSLGLLLAADVKADVDSPPHDKSIVDGYAVLVEDNNGAESLAIVETVLAGSVPTRCVTAGTAIQIMTGAPLPAGANAVVMIEQTQLVGNQQVRIQVLPQPDQNVVRRGAAFRRGDVLLTRGTRIRPIEIGVLAEVGCVRPMCLPRPTLAVLPTGDELVDPSETPRAAQIRNTNGPLLAAMAAALDVECQLIPPARDEKQDLLAKLEMGLHTDVLLISGGVSAGVADLVPGALRELGVTQVFHKVAVKPGKPLWFGTRETGGKRTLVFGLPGNPVSSLVCFHLFVRPALAKLAGEEGFSHPRTEARLLTGFTQRGERECYLPARLSGNGDKAEVELVRWQGSGDLAGLAAANALAIIPAVSRTFARGEKLFCISLDR
jgi:molybdopterin molybdotransferase